MALLDVNQAWYLLIAVFLAGWIILYKNSRKPNIHNDLKIGLVVLVISAAVEFFAVSNGLWSYTPKNWPWQLFAFNLVTGMLLYQLINYFTK